MVNVEAHAAQGSHCRISDVKHYYVCFCFVLFCFVLFVFRFVCFLLVMFCFCFSFFVFFLSHSLSSPFYSLPPSRNSDPGSHSRLFPPPTHYGSCLAFLSREDFSSSLVDSRRIVLTHARRSQQLILFSFFFLQINSKSLLGGIRTHGSTLFEGYHRGDRDGYRRGDRQLLLL